MPADPDTIHKHLGALGVKCDRRWIIAGSGILGSLALLGTGSTIWNNLDQIKRRKDDDSRKAADRAAADREREAKQSEASRKSAALAIATLFGSVERTYLTPAASNPYLHTSSPTPATSFAMNAMLETLGTSKLVKESDDVGELTFEHHASFFGGPVANSFARSVLGTGGQSPLLGKGEGDLRIKFHNVIQDPSTGKPAYRYSIDGQVCSPYGDDDFLLITSIPNVFSDDYEDTRGPRIVLFSGLHGPGTKAVSNLLDDEESLDRLRKLVGTKGAWQALIPVVPNGPNVLSILPPKHVVGLTTNFDHIRRLWEGERASKPTSYSEEDVNAWLAHRV